MSNNDSMRCFRSIEPGSTLLLHTPYPRLPILAKMSPDHPHHELFKRSKGCPHKGSKQYKVLNINPIETSNVTFLTKYSEAHSEAIQSHSPRLTEQEPEWLTRRHLKQIKMLQESKRRNRSQNLSLSRSKLSERAGDSKKTEQSRRGRFRLKKSEPIRWNSLTNNSVERMTLSSLSKTMSRFEGKKRPRWDNSSPRREKRLRGKARCLLSDRFGVLRDKGIKLKITGFLDPVEDKNLAAINDMIQKISPRRKKAHLNMLSTLGSTPESRFFSLEKNQKNSPVASKVGSVNDLLAVEELSAGSLKHRPLYQDKYVMKEEASYHNQPKQKKKKLVQRAQGRMQALKIDTRKGSKEDKNMIKKTLNRDGRRKVIRGKKWRVLEYGKERNLRAYQEYRRSRASYLEYNGKKIMDMINAKVGRGHTNNLKNMIMMNSYMTKEEIERTKTKTTNTDSFVERMSPKKTKIRLSVMIGGDWKKAEGLAKELVAKQRGSRIKQAVMEDSQAVAVSSFETDEGSKETFKTLGIDNMSSFAASGVKGEGGRFY